MVRESALQGAGRRRPPAPGEHAALELDGSETVTVDHPRRLGHDAAGVKRLAPGVRGRARVPGPLVEQVGRERHAVARGPAEQVDDRAPGRLALDVEAGDLEGGEDPVDRVAVAGQAGRDRRPGRREGLDPAVDLVRLVNVGALDGPGRGGEGGQVLLVRVRLAQPGQPGVGGDLDDGAQRERLVHPGRIQQRRVGERDGRDGDLRDTDGLAHGASTARPASMMRASSARCSGVTSASGGRTPPVLCPASSTPALTSEMA